MLFADSVFLTIVRSKVNVSNIVPFVAARGNSNGEVTVLLSSVQCVVFIFVLGLTQASARAAGMCGTTQRPWIPAECLHLHPQLRPSVEKEK